MALAIAEVFWIRMLLHELRIPLHSHSTLWCDNVGAIALASNPMFHARTKYIEVDFYFIHKKVNNKDIQVRHLSTVDQLALKSHTAARLCFLRDKLMVSSPVRLRGCVKGSTSLDNKRDAMAKA